MKSKPNTEQFKLKKNPSDFLEGGFADQSEKSSFSTILTTEAKKKNDTRQQRREQKVFRLSIDLINILKRESYERSLKTGARVTETELVEEALRTFFNI